MVNVTLLIGILLHQFKRTSQQFKHLHTVMFSSIKTIIHCLTSSNRINIISCRQTLGNSRRCITSS